MSNRARALLGEELEQRIGWSQLCRLVAPGEPPGEPDFDAWLSALSATKRGLAEALISDASGC